MLALLKLPVKSTVQDLTSVLTKVFTLDCSHIELASLNSQESGSAAYFMLITPLAHAALADSQNTAMMTVKPKSYKENKGQLISKCPFVAFKSPKNPSKKFPEFLPYPLKRGQIKKVV